MLGNGSAIDISCGNNNISPSDRMQRIVSSIIWGRDISTILLGITANAQ